MVQVGQVDQELAARLEGACHCMQDAGVLRITLEVAEGREQVNDSIELALEGDVAHIPLYQGQFDAGHLGRLLGDRQELW